MTVSPFKLTVFTGTRQLTKSIKLDDGKLVKSTPIGGGGRAKKVELSLKELPTLIGRLTTEQCLIHGTFEDDEIDITPEAYPKKDAIHRTKEYFSYPAGESGLAMFDHDPDDVGQYQTPDDLVLALYEVFPQFIDAARVVKLSTSAEIYGADGNRLSHAQPGYHIYFVAADASDLPRFKEALFKRLWVKGHGYCRLSKAGSILDRCIFDRAVFSPERCDFVSGAILGEGLEQRLPEADYSDGGVLDTSKLADLTKDEEAEYQKMIAAERERLRPEQEPVRRAYSKTLSDRTGETPELVYERLCAAEHGTIKADTVVKTKSGDKLTIDQLVKDGRHGEYIEDPTERMKTWARLYIDGDEEAVVRSFLHGGTTLKVVWGDGKPSFEGCINAAKELSGESSSDEINDVLDLAVRAKPNPIEKRQILTALKDATNMPIGNLSQGFDALRKEKSGPPEDLAHKVAKKTLQKFYANGTFLVRAIDRSFWRYNGKHWERHTDEQVQHNILLIVEESVDPDDASYASTVKAALALITSMQAAEGDVLRLTDEPPPVINCQNGELWVSSDGSIECRLHRYDSYLPYVLDVEYDPSADCPRFDQALLDIFRESSDPEDMVRHILEFIGYAIQPRRDIAAWFMLRGSGRNGKTKFMETVECLLNKKAICSERLANIEKNPFMIGSLAGKLLLIDDDVDTGTKLPDGFLKKVSERKLMTGQLKFKDSFEFICTALPVILVNDYPFTADLSYGLRRRAHIIPFDRVFTNEDADCALFPYIWENELPGVLNRAIEGLVRLRRRGQFLHPEDCQQALDDWLIHANPLPAFIRDECTVSPEAHMPLSIFYTRFKGWSKDIGIRSAPRRNTMKSNLENLGYKTNHSKGGSVIRGLILHGFHDGKFVQVL